MLHFDQIYKSSLVPSLAWLKNGIWALALAGLYSIILVLLRTPGLSFLLENKSLFKSSLIIHVDLSVLVWMLSIACVVWSYSERRYYFEKVFNKLAFIGMILMAISPLLADSNPIMNNYVPILENVWFVLGLSLFTVVTLCFACVVFVTTLIRNNSSRLLFTVKITSSLMYIMVWICFTVSYKQVMDITSIFPIDIEYFYELLFWSGGHLMQFIYTQIVMFVWMILIEHWRCKKLNYYRIYQYIFVINFIASLCIFYGHIAYEMQQYEFTVFFTKHMQYSGGIGPILFMLVLFVDIWKSKPIVISQNSHIKIAFIGSVLVFFIGGLIGILISGVNLSIPAHYHGSIVGISIAFLGFAYAIIPTNQTNSRWPNIQLYLITIGQLLHISGLALAGGYGVLRKNPDGVISSSAKIYMGMLGGGGLIAIIGGLMFVYICGKRIVNLQIKIKTN